MTPFYHALDTGTLAAWLSVAGFGAVGVWVPDWRMAPPPPPPATTQVQWIEPEILLGDADATENPAPAPPAVGAEALPALPAPPELPATAAPEPLPDIPDLPQPPAAAPAKPALTAPTKPRSQTPRGASRPTASSGTSAASAGTGLAAGVRLAAGRMPAPSYPAESRRKGQEGTVTVEFTVDSSGRVISAVAKSPSPWPLLNAEAVATVRRWRFPPGAVMKLQRPIVFQLR